jgi:hypothetical protein
MADRLAITTATATWKARIFLSGSNNRAATVLEPAGGAFSPINEVVCNRYQSSTQDCRFNFNFGNTLAPGRGSGIGGGDDNVILLTL